MARTSDGLSNRIRRDEFVWALGSFCALNRIPFAPELVLKEFPPPYTTDSVVQAVRALSFKIREMACNVSTLAKLQFPCLALLRHTLGAAESPATNAGEPAATGQTALDAMGEASPLPEHRLAIVFEANAERIVYFEGNSNTPQSATPEEFSALYAGVAWLIAPQNQEAVDPDAQAEISTKFGFKWFVPELLKHKKVWRDVLLASLVAACAGPTTQRVAVSDAANDAEAKQQKIIALRTMTEERVRLDHVAYASDVTNTGNDTLQR